MTLRNTNTTIGGKLTIAAAILGMCFIALGLVADTPRGHVAQANSATTSVTVLNTPPQWTVNAFEVPASSSSTPTNAGSLVTWNATATDSSNDSYYLLICKTGAAATPVNSGIPTCAGGLANRWAISSLTVSGIMASVSTTTTAAMPEFNDWWAFVCDSVAIGAQCNAAPTQGIGNIDSNAPFVVNHRPTFTAFLDTSPANPGAVVTWYSTSSDPDTYSGTDQDKVKLFVCKANDFTGSACGAGGTWASSTGYMAADASSTATLINPDPDGTFSAYGFVIDSHGGFAASGGSQGTDSSLVVSNVAPTIAAASISLIDSDGSGNLTLTNPSGQTSNLKAEFTVTDQNSCQTTTATPEIVSAIANVYRSGVTQSGCDQSGEYNANNCYPNAVSPATWPVTCTASSTSCLGTGDSDVVWDCTFPLWYVADATDGTGGPLTDPTYFAQNWLASVQAGDNNSASSSLVESSTGNDVTSFLAYSVSTTTIQYGGLQPGQDTGTVGNTALDRTDVKAAGNVGIDESLYGTDMCPGFPSACSGNATSTIFVANQHYATSSISFSSAIATLVNPGATLLAHVLKSTSTSTQAFVTTHWGIAIPGAITLSGDYLGQNTIIGLTSERSFWQ